MPYMGLNPVLSLLVFVPTARASELIVGCGLNCVASITRARSNILRSRSVKATQPVLAHGGATRSRIYRDGKRKGTAAAKIMSDVAAKLTDGEIAAVASYLSTLH